MYESTKFIRWPIDGSGHVTMLLNVILSFPAIFLGFPVFKTYFIFGVTSKLRFFLKFSILKNTKKQDFEFGRKQKEHPVI